MRYIQVTVSRSRHKRFTFSQPRLGAEMGALALAIVGAVTLSALDLNTSADAALVHPAIATLDASGALDAAAEQGAMVDHVRSPAPLWSGEHDARVWTVRGDDIATIDAVSGDLLEIEFGR